MCCTDSLVVVCGLSSCHAWAKLLHGTWNLSSQTRDQTCVLLRCKAANHWTTREVSNLFFFKPLSLWYFIMAALANTLLNHKLLKDKDLN